MKAAYEILAKQLETDRQFIDKVGAHLADCLKSQSPDELAGKLRTVPLLSLADTVERMPQLRDALKAIEKQDNVDQQFDKKNIYPHGGVHT